MIKTLTLLKTFHNQSMTKNNNKEGDTYLFLNASWNQNFKFKTDFLVYMGVGHDKKKKQKEDRKNKFPCNLLLLLLFRLVGLCLG